MPFDRTSFPGGPGYLIHDGLTLQMQDDWQADDEPKFIDVNTNLQGRVSSRYDDLMGKIACKPLAFGGSIATLFAKLYPWRATMLGQLVFPNPDKTAVIQTASGVSVTYPAARLTKMPALTLAPNKALFGGLEITTLLKQGASGGTAGDFVVVAGSAYTEPSLDPLDILYDTYTLSWGDGPSAPFDAIEVDDSGIVIEPQITLNPVNPSNRGTVNMRIGSVGWTIRFRPLNMTAAQYYGTFSRMDGTGVGRGKAPEALSGALTISGSASGKAKITVPLATPVQKGGIVMSPKDGRILQVTLQAARKSVVGTLQSEIVFGTVA